MATAVDQYKSALVEQDTVIARMKRAASMQKERAKEATKEGIETGVELASAYGVAYLQGYSPEKFQVGTAPGSLVLGSAALIGSLFLGKKSDDQTRSVLAALGRGSLCVYAAMKGLEKGKERAAAGK